jgi:hypothetical protein
MEAKKQAGNFDPVMGARALAAVAGERKAVSSDRFRAGFAVRRAWEL